MKTIDFLNNNFSVPAHDTTYRCSMWKLPDLGQKHHMVRYEPVIQTGHETLLHHAILYFCSGHIDDSYIGQSFDCYHNTPHSISSKCYNVFVAWAIGGQAFNYPAHVGHSLGTAQDPVYFMMETHYDNPQMRGDFVDNSGLRIHLTTELRQHDAGIFQNGVAVDRQQIIPPNYPHFVTSGYCHESCLEQALGNQEIRVFANLLHAHLLGMKLRTRHFRNGLELPPLQEDNNYDFNYQEQRMLKEERVIKKGDSLITECEYDSTQRTGITYGGLSSREEMCLSFMVFYPRLPLTNCLTRIQYKIPDQFSGSDVFHIVDSLDWSKPEVREAFEQDIKESQVINMCTKEHGSYPIG